MASYIELHVLRNSADLLNKVEMAINIKAQSYIDGGTPTTDQLTWSSRVLQRGAIRHEAEAILSYILAANKSNSISQIEGASDATIQAAVDKAVDAMVDGGIV